MSHTKFGKSGKNEDLLSEAYSELCQISKNIWYGTFFENTKRPILGFRLLLVKL